MDSRPRFHEGRLSAGTTEGGARDDMWVAEGGWVPACARTREGMGPRMREDTRTREGEAFTPILAFPPQGGREG